MKKGYSILNQYVKIKTKIFRQKLQLHKGLKKADAFILSELKSNDKSHLFGFEQDMFSFLNKNFCEIINTKEKGSVVCVLYIALVGVGAGIAIFLM